MGGFATAFLCFVGYALVIAEECSANPDSILWGENLSICPEEVCTHPKQRPLIQFGMCGGVQKTIGGTVNQYYSLLNALVLAYAVDADVILPHLQKRSGFQFNVTEASWEPFPIESLYDITLLKSFWGRLGVNVYTQEEIKTLQRPLTRILSPKYLMERELRYWLNVFSELDPCGTTLLDFDCILFAVRSTLYLDVFAEASRWLKFQNDRAEQIAHRIIQDLGSYHAVHLRVEADASVWGVTFQEQLEAAITATEETFARNMSKVAATSIYIASGVFGYNATLAEHVVAEFSRRFHLPVHFHKENLTALEFSSLNSEEEGLIDLIVCIFANSFVGYGESSFSFFVGEQRRLRVLELDTRYYGGVGRVFLSSGVLSTKGQLSKRMSTSFSFDP
jgi:hypothetical protein